MKKTPLLWGTIGFLVIVALAYFIAAPAPSNQFTDSQNLLGLVSSINEPASVKTFDRDLYFGLKSDEDVTRLQEFLRGQNLYDGPTTGNFFALTKAGAVRFQEREGVSPAAGYVGALTRGRINTFLQEAAATTPTTVPETAASDATEPQPLPSSPETPAPSPAFTLDSITTTAVANNPNPQTIYATLTFKNDDSSGVVLTRLNFAPLLVRANADAFVRGEAGSKITLYSCDFDAVTLSQFTAAWSFVYSGNTSLYTYIYVPPRATRNVCLKITKVTVKSVTAGSFALPITGAEIDRTDVTWNPQTLNAAEPQTISWTVK